MTRSLGFGFKSWDSYTSEKGIVHISYASTYRLKLATKLDSLTHYAKGTLSLSYPHMVDEKSSNCLLALGFSVFSLPF